LATWENILVNESKGSRSESRLEKTARESDNVRVSYDAQARAVREKTARLRSLRLAKEAADKAAAKTNK
jgi:hypothetical protein